MVAKAENMCCLLSLQEHRKRKQKKENPTLRVSMAVSKRQHMQNSLDRTRHPTTLRQPFQAVRSKNTTRPPLLRLLRPSCPRRIDGTSATILWHLFPFLHRKLMSHSRINRHIENLMHAVHLLAAAFDIGRTHLLGDALSLLRRYRGETLGLEQVDTLAFRAQIGFETDEDEGCCGAEVEDFGIPLWGTRVRGRVG